MTNVALDIERLEVSTGLEAIADLDDGLLAEAGALVTDAIKRLRAVLTRLDQESLRRLREQEATKLPTRAVVVELAPPTKKYTWDPKALVEKAAPLMTAGMWEDCVTLVPPLPPLPTYDINTRKLLGIAKSLGKRGDAIMECCEISESAPRVTYTLIPEEDRAL